MAELILENARFLWSINELETFRILWEQGKSIEEIADRFKETPGNIALLVIDQAQKGKITYGN